MEKSKLKSKKIMKSVLAEDIKILDCIRHNFNDIIIVHLPAVGLQKSHWRMILYSPVVVNNQLMNIAQSYAPIIACPICGDALNTETRVRNYIIGSYPVADQHLRSLGLLKKES